MGMRNRYRGEPEIDFDQEIDFGNGATSSNPYGNSAVASGKSLARGGSATDTATAGLIASGNPYAIGAGVGLQVLSARGKRKQKEAELESKLKLDRISRQQKALSNLMNVTQRFTI